MKYYIMAFKRYATSEGRSSRRELIWFFVFQWLIYFLLNILEGLLSSGSYGILSGLYMLASICPTVCLEIRRLHDVGKSGAWWWIALVPLLNFYLIYLLVFKRGEECANRFGPPVRHNTPAQADMPRQDEAVNGSLRPSQEARGPRFCAYCGAELSQGARFCRMCGAGVSEPTGEQIPY